MYDSNFYDNRNESLRSAEIVLPIVFEMFSTKSVMDLGCGNGSWLRAAIDLGCTDVLGIDGPWIEERSLIIPVENFRRANFEVALPNIGRTFDLAITLEVVEHISETRADETIEWLCHHAPVILFSAAIPGQGGYNHVNEDWLSSWVRRFVKQGFAACDVMRPLLWNDNRLPFWYPQNMIIMASEEAANNFGLCRANPEFLDLVHPRLFSHVVRKMNAAKRG